MIYRHELEALLTKLKNQRDFVNDRIEEMMQGRLLISRRGKKTEFFQEYYIKGKRVRKSVGKNNDCVGELARKQYMMARLQIIDKNIALMDALLKEFTAVNHSNIKERLPQRLKELPEDIFAENSLADNEYNQSTYMSAGRVHCTSRGLKVRSKSELLIAEKLYEYCIQFRYEEVREIGKYTIVPDFTIKRGDGKMFYWEHCGRTHDKKYMEHHRWKMQLYEGVGILPWDNLIITYDDQWGRINLAAVDGEIRAKLLV